MRIPDCRVDKNYNQKYLMGADKDFVRGYDWCAEMVVDNFFNNLDMYFDTDSFTERFFNTEVPEVFQEPYRHKSEEREIKTYGDMFQAYLLDWIERGRDELITSMIDGMSKEEYAEARKKANAEE